MFFLLRAVFWTVLVAVFVPGAVGTTRTADLQTLESLKTDAILVLARVRMELNARDMRVR
jgi:hypothetical protein